MTTRMSCGPDLVCEVVRCGSLVTLTVWLRQLVSQCGFQASVCPTGEFYHCSNSLLPEQRLWFFTMPVMFRCSLEICHNGNGLLDSISSERVAQIVVHGVEVSIDVASCSP